jgi:hypothetical protein
VNHFFSAAQSHDTSSIFQLSLHDSAEPNVECDVSGPIPNFASERVLLVVLPDAFEHASDQVTAHESRLSHAFFTSNASPEDWAVVRTVTHSLAESARAGAVATRVTANPRVAKKSWKRRRTKARTAF